jgi:hypothetical protein
LPSAGALLRLLGFTVPSLLALAGVQPLLGAAAGGVGLAWALGLTVPAVSGAALILAGGRLLNPHDSAQPPWYSAWVLLPGAFALVGAASMCIFGALVEFALIRPAMWMLLVAGIALWWAAMLVVRLRSTAREHPNRATRP